MSVTINQNYTCLEVPAAQVDWSRAVSFSDDLITGNPGTLNVPQGPMGLLIVSVAGGGVSAIANYTQPVSGRMGLWAIETGTTSNTTGQGLIYTDALSLWVGGGLTANYYCTAMLPILSTVTNEYQVEMGFRTGFSAAAGNAIAFLYNRQTSTNWQAFTANNGTITAITTVDTQFAVVAGTWYNFKISLNAASVDFYIAPAGTQDYQLLGSSSTNLPSASFPTYLAQTIYRTVSFALRRQLVIDRVAFDATFTVAR